jgi:molecular chaperone GrpE
MGRETNHLKMPRFSVGSSCHAFHFDEMCFIKFHQNDYVAAGCQRLNGEDFRPMNDLIQLYMTAFLEGNNEVLGVVEKAIAAVEKENSRVAYQLESITTEINSGKEKFIRLNANLENFRKQAEKDGAKFTSNIRVDVVQSLLPLVDSFEKTKLENTPGTEKEQMVSTSYQGIYKQLVETLRYLGVGVVETVGNPFDPLVSNIYPSVTCLILIDWVSLPKTLYANNILDPFEHAKRIMFEY